MLNAPTFYHATTKKAIIVFGNLFNNIHIQRFDESGNLQDDVKVPLSYAPKEKFLARERQQPDIDKRPIEISLPRMGFEITGFQRDGTRQMNAMQNYRSIANGNVGAVANPVPYNLTVTLYIAAKTQDDALQIVEQIIPWFNPTYTVTINAVPELGLTNDVPITLESVQNEDDYDDTFEKRRQVTWMLTFVVSMNYYGPTDMNRGMIKRTEVSLFSNPAMEDSQKMEEIDNEVVPFSANSTDPYTISTTIIEGFE